MSEFRRRLMMAVQGGAVPMPDYLAFTALEDGTFTLTIGANVTTNNFSYVEYSIDNGRTWVKTSNIGSTEVVVTTPTVLEGKTVYWRGSGARTSNTNSGNNTWCIVFSSTGKFNVSGLLMSLLVGENATESSTIPNTYAFPRLFYGNKNIVDASELIMPNNTTSYCYDYFFEGCSNLTLPPTLPATTLSEACYRYMFQGCSALSCSPDLPAQTLVSRCYYQMLRNCSSIRYIKMLATDVSASNCLYVWVDKTTNSSSVIFVKNINAEWDKVGTSGIQNNWTIIYYDPSTDKYYLDQNKETECDDHGNVIN